MVVGCLGGEDVELELRFYLRIQVELAAREMAKRVDVKVVGNMLWSSEDGCRDCLDDLLMLNSALAPTIL